MGKTGYGTTGAGDAYSSKTPRPWWTYHLNLFINYMKSQTVLSTG